MQKLLLLPQMDKFKVNIFTPRLCIFNETFAEVGKKGIERQEKAKDTVVVWHEAIAGRCDEDVTSSLITF